VLLKRLRFPPPLDVLVQVILLLLKKEFLGVNINRLLVLIRVEVLESLLLLLPEALLLREVLG